MNVKIGVGEKLVFVFNKNAFLAKCPFDNCQFPNSIHWQQKTLENYWKIIVNEFLLQQKTWKLSAKVAIAQQTFTCSNSTIETLEKVGKYVES